MFTAFALAFFTAGCVHGASPTEPVEDPNVWSITRYDLVCVPVALGVLECHPVPSRR